MKVWMLWHGGHSYAVPERKDAEELPSIKAAMELFQDRYDNFNVYPETPCVDLSATGWLFFADPRLHDEDLYPDRILEFGPRRGLYVTKL